MIRLNVKTKADVFSAIAAKNEKISDPSKKIEVQKIVQVSPGHWIVFSDREEWYTWAKERDEKAKTEKVKTEETKPEAVQQ